MEKLDQIKVIIGLGNPGTKYRYTYHNAGHLLIDWLVDSLNFKAYRSFSYCRFNSLTLAKTETFMNDSGSAVKSLLEFTNTSPEELLVIHDDSDLKLGESKLIQGGSSAGHKGLESIISVLGTSDFFRFRVGIRHDSPDQPRAKAEDFVLKTIPPSALKLIYNSGNSLRSKLKLNDTLEPT